MKPCYPLVWISVLSLWVSAAQALEPADPAKVVDWEKRLSTAKAKQEEAKRVRLAEMEQYEAEQKACYKKFRVIDCQIASQQRHATVLRSNRLLDNEGKTEERTVHKEQLDDKDARQAADAPRKAADLKTREARIQKEQQTDEQARSKKLADKDQQQARNAHRRSEDAAKLSKKQAAHERHVREKIEKAERRAREEAAKAPAKEPPKP